MSAPNGTALAVAGGIRPEISAITDSRTLGRWRRSYGAVQPQTLQSIVRNLEQGQQLEDWVDLAGWMAYTDATVRAALGTRIGAVAGADFEVLPGRARPGEETLAQEAADGWREDLEDCPDLERLFADLLYGGAIGWAGAENMWRPNAGLWSNRPAWIDSRDFRTEQGGQWTVRDARQGYGWAPIAAHPGKFILHTPRNISTIPTLSGDLLAVCWPWLFKRWGEKFWVAALEKWAAPFVYGKATSSTPKNIREQLRQAIELITSGAAGVIEVDPTLGDPLVALDVSDSVKEAYSPAIDYFNAEIIKGILGSTLNTEVGSTGGNRALGESQGATTILPRNMSDAKRLAGTLERDWAAWWCRYNAHHFGRVPPTPRFSFTLIREEEIAKEINAYHMRGYLVTPNEIRAQLRQDPWTPEQLTRAGLPPEYGDTPLNLVDEPAPGGAPAEVPFQAPRPQLTAARPKRPARQLPLPLTSRNTTSRTTSASATSPLGSALRSALGDPAK